MRQNGSERIELVQEPIIPVIADLIAANPGTISLGQGVVHYGPPPETLARLTEFWSDPANHKYRPVQGLPELTARLGDKLKTENGLDMTDSALFVTAGSNMAFLSALYAITEPGDEVILPTPYYFNHEMAITMAGCRPVTAPLDANYQLDIEAIQSRITPATRAIVTVSPNNPSGAVYSRESLQTINALCAARGIYHISDEAYEYFIYDDAEHYSPGSAAGAGDHTISLYSLSKAYGFAGWRIGYMVIPSRLTGAVRKVQDTMLICAAVISQFAALGALDAGPNYCRGFLADLAKARQYSIDRLADIADLCSAPASKGAFYLLLRLNTGLDEMEIVRRLVSEYGVAAIPGNAFGFESGRHLRISYGALKAETAAAGMDRLVTGLREILSGS